MPPLVQLQPGAQEDATRRQAAARLQERRERLELIACSLGREAQTLRSDLDASDAFDEDHPIAPIHDIERVTWLERSLVEERDAVDEALWRLELGDYGACQSCGDEIPAERLEVRPHARECVPCASYPR